MASTQDYINAMSRNFQPGRANGLNLVYLLQLSGADGGMWGIQIAHQQCQVSTGAPANPTTTISMSTDQYRRLSEGGVDILRAYQHGQIRVSGNVPFALKFVELFKPWAGLVQTSAPPPAPVPSSPPTVADYVQAMPKGFRADRAAGISLSYRLVIDGQPWTLAVRDRQARINKGEHGPVGTVIEMSGDLLKEMARGRLNAGLAVQQGKLRVHGNQHQALQLPQLFNAWEQHVANNTVTISKPSPTQPDTSPSGDDAVYPRFMNGSFDEYQPYNRPGEGIKTWREFPEQIGKYWTLEVISEADRRIHPMDSTTFGKFTQKYFRGGGRDYHIEGHHSQVITSRYGFDLVLRQTVQANPGRTYTFKGAIVTFYKGTATGATHNKIFLNIGIDPIGGDDYRSGNIAWSGRDGRNNEWRYPQVQATARASRITVFIRLENTERDVGQTELNTIHLDKFELVSR